MARILAEKSEFRFSPSHSFCGCTTFWRGTALGQPLVDDNFMTQDLHLLDVYMYIYVLLKVTAAAVSAA